ncbi:MAG: DMT family transporter [Gemmatimonadaceae bacterium]|nr:DMT family transporter [Gemmatimonadaceae bacterium]
MLGLALLGISFAGPLVKLSASEPLAIAAWRLFFSLILVGGFLVATGEWREWRHASRSDAGLSVLAGVLLALHFWAWNASIQLTTIAASVTLVSLQPAFVVGISVLFLREYPSRLQVTGILIAFAGAMVIALPSVLGDDAIARNAFLGNLLAISAAMTAGAYYTIGRRVRASMGVWAYVGIVYFSCFATVVAIALARATPLYPMPSRELSIFAGLAIGPMLLGHTGMNWALKYMPAYIVNLLVLGEPVGATLIGALVPGIGQIPSPVTMLGSAIVLGGVIIAAHATRAMSSADR